MKFRLTKSKGNNANVTLSNDKGSSLALGRLSIPIINALKKDGYTLESSDDSDGRIKLNITDEWSLEITEETAKVLQAEAFKIHKPAKDTTPQQPTSDSSIKVDTKKIDAMDVLLGLANYN